MKIHITKRAALDLDEIYQYSVEKWGNVVAEEYMQSVDLGLQTLKRNPELLRANTPYSTAFSVYKVREHYLICSQINQDILLLTVKSGKLDLPTRLLELEPTLIKEAEFLYSGLLEK